MKNKFEPYYAVIFTSTQTNNIEGYSEMAIQMEALAKEQPGFINMESARDGLGITVSYWESLEAIKNWKQESEHVVEQIEGRENWYSWYHVRICIVEREYEFLRK